MPDDVSLRPLWSNNTFRVYKGKLKGKALLDGALLGHGLIYYAGQANITHSISGASRGKSVTFPKRTNCIWNPGSFTQVRNVGSHAVRLLRVAPKYRRELIKNLPQDALAAATALLVSGNWPKSFKKSIAVDLQAMGTLALALSRDVTPSPEQIMRARAAQEDFEFKLEWMVRQSSKWLDEPVELLQNIDLHGPEGRGVWPPTWRLGKKPAEFLRTPDRNISGGGSGQPTTGRQAEPPYDPSVQVTVNTKDQSAKDVGGCEVFWNLYGYGNDYSHSSRFGELSTPTVEVMVVGIYTMWTKRQGLLGERTKIDVGLKGQTSQRVDLFAPQA